MKLSVVYRSSVPASASPYRLLDEREEIAWSNSFLDAQRIRQLSVRSLRAYAYDLLHFARWWSQHPAKPLSEITESTLLDYVRYQLDQTHHEATILSLLAFRERTDCYCMLVMAMRRPRTRPYPDERRDQKSHTSRGCITRESVAAGVEESHHGITRADSSTRQLHGDTVPERVPHQLTPCALSG